MVIPIYRLKLNKTVSTSYYRRFEGFSNSCDDKMKGLHWCLDYSLNNLSVFVLFDFEAWNE